MKVPFMDKKGRLAPVALVVLILALILSGCGAEATPTPVPVPTDTPVVAAPTDTAAAPTEAVMTPTEAEMTPTEVEMTATVAVTTTTSGTTSAGATPVSDWKPGKYPNSVTPPAKLVAAGLLTVGSDTTYPPQEYIDASGKAVGFDIDIAEEIASRMGLTAKIITFKFDDIIPALNAGQFDIVVSAMTITDERKKAVDFVQYFEAGQAIMVKKGNPLGIKGLDDLSGHTVAVQTGTVEEQTLKDINDKLNTAGKPKVNILTYTADTDAVDNLRVGRAEASMHDSPVAAYYAKLSPDTFEVAVPNMDSAPEGIVVAKNNPNMLAAVQKAVDAMKADGTLDAIKAKWGVK